MSNSKSSNANTDSVNSKVLFIALMLPQYLQVLLAEEQDLIKSLNLPLKWANPAGFHLTLKYLGATEADLIPQINAELMAIAAKTPHFDLSITHLGTFPHWRRPRQRPRVLWAGIDEPWPELQTLQESVEAAISPLGFPPELRSFRPHITLGRIKEIAPTQLSRLAQHFKSRTWAFPKWEVEHISLVESQPTPGGRVYVALKQFPFHS